MSEPILSILVITHNQRDLLKRCMQSVLGQKLNVPFEVIVSDDRSNDGTAEFMTELIRHWKDGKVAIKNLVDIAYTRCNSNDCHPVTVSQRCAWNKLNVWKHARGKYMVNIDADDYLRTDNIYQAQLDMLMAHPECSMCQQRIWKLNDGEPIENGCIEFVHPAFKDDAILSVNQILAEDLRDMNPSYMMRRNPNDDMASLYGKWYDDTVISYHHMQYGPVIFLDRVDYVWVQYPKSISHDMTKDDQTILYGLLPLHHASIIPAMRYDFLKYGLRELIHLFKVAPHQPDLSEQYRNYLKEEKGFIYRYFTANHPSLPARIKFALIRAYMLTLRRLGLERNMWFSILYKCLK